jgi:tetratricopeptide (TPR) repeat protein
MPLSGLSISAVADRVVVREGGSRWQADSGQYLLAFDGDPADGSLSVIERARASATAPAAEATDWFDMAVALERVDADAALRAYEDGVAADPERLDARINLGRLLHEARRFPEAVRVYADALLSCGNDPLLLYNFGVLLEDMNRKPDAVRAYEGALRGDPDFADCHYNLALLYEKLRKPKDAIRHMAQYRRLVGSSAD